MHVCDLQIIFPDIFIQVMYTYKISCLLFSKFLYKIFNSAAIKIPIDLQFSSRAGRSISIAISPRSICYLFNNRGKKKSGVGNFDRSDGSSAKTGEVASANTAVESLMHRYKN